MQKCNKKSTTTQKLFFFSFFFCQQKCRALLVPPGRPRPVELEPCFSQYSHLQAFEMIRRITSDPSAYACLLFSFVLLFFFSLQSPFSNNISLKFQPYNTCKRTNIGPSFIHTGISLHSNFIIILPAVKPITVPPLNCPTPRKGYRHNMSVFSMREVGVLIDYKPCVIHARILACKTLLHTCEGNSRKPHIVER